MAPPSWPCCVLGAMCSTFSPNRPLKESKTAASWAGRREGPWPGQPSQPAGTSATCAYRSPGSTELPEEHLALFHSRGTYANTARVED